MRKQPGISAMNLMLMGGVAALLLDKRLRQRVVGGTRSAIDTTQDVLENDVLPALSNAAEEAQHSYQRWQKDGGAEHTVRRAQHLLGQIQKEAKRSDIADQASGWLDDLTDRLSGLAQNVQTELERRASDAEDTLEDVRRSAKKGGRQLAYRAEDMGDAAEDLRRDARRKARRLANRAEDQYDDVQGAFMGFLGRTGDELEDRRRHLERDLQRARRNAEKELRREKRNWNEAKLSKAIEKKVAPLQRTAEREFADFAKDVKRQKAMAAKQARADQRSSNGGLVALGLLAAGGAILWSSPEARHAVLDGIEKVSPDARHYLERVGRSMRASVGEVWLEPPKDQGKESANQKLGKTADPNKGTGNPATGAPAPAAQDDAKTPNKAAPSATEKGSQEDKDKGAGNHA